METIRKMMKRVRLWRSRRFNISPRLLPDISEKDNSSNETLTKPKSGDKPNNSVESTNVTSKSSNNTSKTSNNTSKTSNDTSTRRKSKSPNDRSRFFRRNTMHKSKSVPCYVGSQFETSDRRQDTSDSSGATYAELDNSSSTFFDSDETWSTTTSGSYSSIDSDVNLGLSQISLSDETVSTRREAILVTKEYQFCL